MSEWKEVSIGTFLIERAGRYKPDDILLHGLQRIEKIDFSGKIYLSHKTSNTDMILVRKGDFIISGINVAKGAMATYDYDKEATATIHYSSYIFDENKIDPEYFRYFLKSPEFIRVLKSQVKGGIKTEIKAKQFLSLRIILPSLKKQRAIRERINDLHINHSRLVTVHSDLKNNLTKLRKQILHDAVSGKLTESWRINATDSEPISKVLSEVEKNKNAFSEINSKKSKKLHLLETAIEQDLHFAIPTNWVWEKLGNIIYEPPRNGYSPKSVDYVTATKTLKLGATSSGVFNPAEIKYIDETIDGRSHLWLKTGDILIQRSNALNIVGVSAIFDQKDNEFIYPDLMMKVRVCEPIDSAYIHIVLSSPVVRDYYRARATGTQKTMPKINQTTVLNTPIPLPPLEEQIKIKQRVQSLVHQCDRLTDIIQKDMILSKRLLETASQSIFSPKQAEERMEDEDHSNE